MSPRAALRVIDEHTALPLKVVVPVMLSIAGLVWWLSMQFGGLNDRISRLEWKMDQIGARASNPNNQQTFTRGMP